MHQGRLYRDTFGGDVMSDWYDISSYLPWTGYRGNYGGWVNDQLVEYLLRQSVAKFLILY